jgi:hypothetical protein
VADLTPYQCFAGLIKCAIQSRGFRCTEAEIERLYSLRAQYGPSLEDLLDFVYEQCDPKASVVQQYLDRYATRERAVEEKVNKLMKKERYGTCFPQCRFCAGHGCLACPGEAKRSLMEAA